MIRGLVSVSLLAVCGWDGAGAECPVVQVEQGLLQGREVTSILNTTYCSYQRIPYAKPPLGELRFKDAQPPEAWDGVRDATEEGPMCTQLDRNDFKFRGSEDCLFLNVYTPQRPGAQCKPVPVMVWFHGGGFVFGAGNSDVYGPDFFMEEGVIVVTINYRLTCFGFLFLNKTVPGNAGLKDQVAALRWVQKNIAAFNGDPRKVTIFGESAGGASTNWHMLSPMSKGLFHRAIAQSGAAMNPWALAWKPYETSRRLASAVDCTGDDEQAVACMRRVNASQLVQAAEQAPTLRDRDRLMMFPFTPTVEEVIVPGVETFVVGAPEELMKEGRIHDVPYLLGMNNEEWMLTIGLNRSIFASQENLRMIDSNWTRYILPETGIRENSKRIPEALEDLRNFWLEGQNLTFENLQKFKDMLTDLQFGEGIYYCMKYMARSIKSNIFFYSLIIDRELNFLKNLFHLNFPGTSHADDLGYLWRTHVSPNVSSDSVAYITRWSMVRMWSNFAKCGDPTPPQYNVFGKRWKPYTCSERNYLEIGDELKPSKDLNEERVQFWEGFYKKYYTERQKKGIYAKGSRS